MTLTLVVDDSWRQQAACRGLGPDLFYAADQAGIEQAKAICATCPVQTQCLEYAVAAGEPDGVWGGKGWGARHHMPTPPRPTRCRWCRTVFDAHNAHVVYCGDECRRLAYNQHRYDSRQRTAV